MDLSSEFFAAFWRSPYERETTVFTQKIPRSGYFDAVFSGSEDFQRFVSKMERRAASVTNNEILQENLYNALLRYGRFRFVIDSTSTECPEHLQHPRQVALTNASLSAGECPDVEGTLSALRSRCVDETKARRLARITRGVVCAYRYNAASRLKSIADAYLAEALSLIEDLKVDGRFADLMAASVCYRGLAMIHGIEAGSRQAYLDQATTLAHMAMPDSELERIVRSENIWIVNQTMSKVHTAAGRLDAATDCLKEMIRYDPFNPAGHTELGFFFLRQKMPREALPHFLESIRLGPPGLAMNCFYAGECSRLLGDIPAARRLYQESMSHDPTAISAQRALDALNRVMAS
jgi:tetratricopeptide (TPR) repeat protein